MVTPSFPARQACIRKMFWACIFVAGCQTTPKQPAPTPLPPQTAPQTSSQFPRLPVLPPSSIAQKSVPVPAPQPPPQIQVQQAPDQPAPPSPTISRPRSAPQLPDSIGNWRVTPISRTDWLVVPVKRQTLSDSIPSLMEDAIITSGIHSRLQSISSLRATTWKYTSNAGKVRLQCSELTTSQAIAALRAITTLDKVVEIHLTTTLR